MTSRHDHEVTAEFEHGRRRGRRPNAGAFVGPLMAWGPGLAVVGLIMAFIGHSFTIVFHRDDPHIAATYGLDDQDARATIGLMLVVVAVSLSVVVGLYGARIVKRDPVIVIHLLGSVWLTFLILYISSQWGWSLSWVLWHVALSTIGGASWAILRTDALRKDPREKGDDKNDGGYRDALGVANTEVKAVEPTRYGVRMTIKHLTGSNRGQLVKALPNLEAEVGAVDGMSFLTRGKNLSETKVDLITKDPWTEWREWPGLSHPGGSFADSFVTSYYVTGDDAPYWFAANHSRSNPRQRSGKVRAGATGAGKSGDLIIEVAEGLSRRDTITVVVFMGKFRQNLGWAEDMITLIADTQAKARALEAGIWNLVAYRAGIMHGTDQDRDWSPEAYRKYGFAAVHFVYDEADKILGKLAEDIATTALAVGVFMSVTLPDTDHRSMPVKVRRSLGIRDCYGTGDKYTHTMILQESTAESAPAPFEIGTTIPGWHIMDRVNGIDPALFTVPCRTYYATQERLRAAVVAARRQFEPAVFTSGEIECFRRVEGDAWEMCQPALVGMGVQPAGVQPTPGVQPAAEPTAQPAGVQPGAVQVFTEAQMRDAFTQATAAVQAMGQPMNADTIAAAASAILNSLGVQHSAPGEQPRASGMPFADAQEGEQVDIPDEERTVVNFDRPMPPGSASTAEQRAEWNKIPRKDEYVRKSKISIDFDDVRPQPVDQAAADAEFDRVIRQMVEQGVSEFRNQDLLERCELWSDVMMTRRLRDLADPQKPAIVMPPGVKLIKLSWGHWQLVYEQAPAGAAHGPGNGKVNA